MRNIININLNKINLQFILFLILTNNFFSLGLCSDFQKEEEIQSISNSQVASIISIDEISDTSESPLIEISKAVSEKTEDQILRNEISPFSDSYVFAFKEDAETNISKFLAFKYVTSIFGGIGPCIPQVAISLKTGEYYGSSLLGYALAGAQFLTIEGITAWMIWELLDDAQKIVQDSRAHHSNSNTCNIKFVKGVGIGLFSFILGALSSTPDVYKTYKYNTIKELAIISFVYDTIPRTLGFYKLFSSLKLKINNLCKKEEINKDKSMELVDLSKAYFLDKCRENGTTDTLEALKNCSTPKEIYSYLSTGFEQNITQQTLPQYYGKGIPRKIFQYLALIFPIASASFNMVLAYNGYNLLIDNQPAMFLLSGVSVLPVFFLSSHVIMQASGSVFDKIYLRKFKIPSSDYFSTFHPKTRIAFIGTSLLLGTAASAGGFYVISDNLKDTFLNPVKYGFSTLGVVADLTFGSYTVYSTLTNFGGVIKKRYDKSASYILNCLKKLDDVRESIIHSSSDFVDSFVDEINNHLEPSN